MTGPFTAACIQNEAVADMDASIEAATALVRAARGAGAELICLPEYFSCYKAAAEIPVQAENALICRSTAP